MGLIFAVPGHAAGDRVYVGGGMKPAVLWADMQVTLRPAPGQERVYAFIVEYKRTHDGNSPTYGQIAQGCGINKTTAYIHCLKLFRDRRISFTEDRRIILIGGEYSPPE